jgi:hypothetical protein
MRLKERGNGQYEIMWRDADQVWWDLGHLANSYQQALRLVERYATCSAAIFTTWSSGKRCSEPEAAGWRGENDS